VVVTARVNDPDGVGTFLVRYRADPAVNYTELPLRDDGTAGDAVPNDGIFSATLPGRPAGSVTAFVLVATDPNGVSTRFPALLNDNAPVRECVVVFGDPNPPSSFGAYHLWLTKTNVNRWIALPVLSNEEIDATVVVGSRVIYNAGARYSGSPYHQAYDSPLGNRACHYIWSMPKDDRLLGVSSFNKLHWPGNDIQNDTATQNVNDATLQREQTANTFLRGLGVPWVNRRYVAVYVNGRRRGAFMEDALRPSGSVEDEYFPDDTGGRLYKFQPWFEFGLPSGNSISWANQSWCLFMPYKTTGGAFKTARYRWCYETRATPDTASNYTNLFSLITAGSAGSATNYVAAMENQADMENWMRLVAANHAAGNWDCWGVENEQNVYGYVSPQRRWTLFMFDMGIVLGNPISWSPGQNLFSVNGSDANWQRIYSTPKFRRMYLRALKELVEGAMSPNAVNALVQAKYAAFVADGVTVQSPGAISTWVSQARTSIGLRVAADNASQFSVAGTNLVATGNAVTLSGTAPLVVTTVVVNGQSYEPTWTSTTNWTLRIPASNGTAPWLVAARDRFNKPVGATNQITVTNPSVPENPVGNVVISEIMLHPTVAGAEYVELFNRSRNTPFDLSGWRLNGLSYTFPPGTTIGARQYLVLARSRITFASTYGALVPVFGEFDGELQTDGETLSLLATPSSGVETVIDRVKYENTSPWPNTTLTPGRALQLRDPDQDNSRVANWSVAPATDLSAPQWVYFATNGIVSSSRLYIYLESPGEILVDDLKLVYGLVPEAGTNLIRNGDFESTLSGSWTLTPNFTQSAVSASAGRLGGLGLRVVASAAGSGSGNSIFQDISPGLTSQAPVALSFWYRQTTNTGPINIRLSNAGITGRTDPLAASLPPGTPATPAAANSAAEVLPAFPTLWLNEVLTVNGSGVADNFGERDPWIEIYNPSSSPVSLAGLYFGTNYSAPTQWVFPPDATIAAGQFLTVWCDGQPEQSVRGALHTNFRLGTNDGAIILSRFVSSALQWVDYLNFPSLPANQSYGDVPDAQPFFRQGMFHATPGSANNAALPPTTLSINEWMADNADFSVDPGTGKPEDWFEIYNPTITVAELGGYFLTDNLTNPFQYQIPNGYRVPANGFLLVWADGKASANSTNHPELHVSFKLAKEGEALGLFAPDGTAVSTVTFGPQSGNLSEGRYFDGGDLRLVMTTPTPGTPNQAPPALAPPMIGEFRVLPGQSVALTLQIFPGHTYRVEYKDNLSDESWIPMPGDVFATESLQTFEDRNPSLAQRFYRVVQLN
jgi:hypothetical protein